MASVQTRARASKSAKSPKCPTCGTVLVVERDTPDVTTLRCPKCSKRNTGEWLATEGAYKAVRAAARKHRGLSLSDLDDLTQELVVAVLEAGVAPADEAEFAAWLDRTAYKVAGGLRNEELEQPGCVDTEVLAATVVGREECELTTEGEWDEWEKANKARAARIKRALKKLSDDHRAIIVERFFKKANLAQSARADEACDSRDRTRLWRAKRRLAELVDADGYAVAA